MAKGRWVRVAVVLAVPVVALAGCGRLFGGDSGAGEISSGGSGDTHVVQEMRRMGLGVAEEVASDGGVGLQPYDSLGKGRDVDEPREWKVCFQSPEPGSYAVPVTALVGAVQVDEACPAQDAGVGPAINRATMPAFTGRPALLVRTTLGEAASIAYRDVEGDGTVSEDDLADYRVCSQSPAAGEPYNGVPVTVRIGRLPDAC